MCSSSFLLIQEYQQDNLTEIRYAGRWGCMKGDCGFYLPFKVGTSNRWYPFASTRNDLSIIVRFWMNIVLWLSSKYLFVDVQFERCLSFSSRVYIMERQRREFSIDSVYWPSNTSITLTFPIRLPTIEPSQLSRPFLNCSDDSYGRPCGLMRSLKLSKIQWYMN